MDHITAEKLVKTPQFWEYVNRSLNDTAGNREPPRPTKEGDNAWKRIYTEVEKHDNEMCKGWNEEIQNLLIFASLFAATVTAFTVESYKWLESDPAETTAKMMTQISLQLANMTNPLAYVGNSALTSLSFDTEPRKSYAVAVNTLWFLSLSISLSTVLVGILCLQWVREYQRDAHHLPAMDAVLLRQLRYVGLTGWGVPFIISMIPVFLQLAVLLFFAGLCHLLYELDRTVATTIMTVTGIVAFIVFGTALAPITQMIISYRPTLPEVQCPYKSPQALLYSWMTCLLRKWLTRWLATHLYIAGTFFRSVRLREASHYLNVEASNYPKFQSWAHWDEQWRTSVGQGVYIRSFLGWIRETWRHRKDILDVLTHILTHLDESPLVDMISLLFQPDPSWFSNDFGKQLHDEVHRRITQSPKDLASLPLEQHEKLAYILNREYVHTIGRCWSSELSQPLSQFVYWSWMGLNPAITTSHKYELQWLMYNTFSHATRPAAFLHADNSQQSEGVSKNEVQELNTSAMETCLTILGFSDIRSPLFTSFIKDPIKDDLSWYIPNNIQVLCQQVLPVLYVKKEYWKQKVNEGDNGWRWLVSLTAGIQLVLTRHRMVDKVRQDHPEWKNFYETVMEIEYGPWEGHLPLHPNHSEQKVRSNDSPAQGRIFPAPCLPCLPGSMHMAEC
ncbi:hypothetical protein AX16_004997 [Volvariella volvacea WC 439]|nr:hypothetical protein AX16_004997 [Volvariella volvacea WC 439]